MSEVKKSEDLHTEPMPTYHWLYSKVFNHRKYQLKTAPSILGGYGTFPQEPIPKDTIIYQNSTLHESLPINDGQFVYPKDFKFETLKECFNSYLANSTGRHVNTKYWDLADGDFALIASRNIAAGEEITKYYGLSKWAVMLSMDIYGENAAPLAHKRLDDADEYFDNLKQVLVFFGYSLSRKLASTIMTL
jgi:hypothetical protein